MTPTKKLIPLALTVAVVVPTIGATTAAHAAIKNPQADAAMRKGIRDVARLEANGAKAHNIKVACVPVPKVNDHKPCTGSFDLTRNGRTAHYVLTAKARTFRIAKGAIEYRVASKAIKKVNGLPGSTDLAGFLQ
ncbi:MAG TPA: hypothetical protein VI318_07755 [Baekduia sp.]